MRQRRAHHRRMGLPLEQEIVAEAALAGEQPLVLGAADRFADEAEIGLVHRGSASLVLFTESFLNSRCIPNDIAPCYAPLGGPDEPSPPSPPLVRYNKPDYAPSGREAAWGFFVGALRSRI